jgi:DnaK suppressor protein
VLSAEELRQFEEILEDRKKQLTKNINDANSEIDSLHSIELNDEADFASASSDDFTDKAIADQQSRELGEIEEALVKIKDKSYGICDMCEEEISIERLKVKPFAKFCITCREIYEKSPKK